jgi:hypothetical protein
VKGLFGIALIEKLTGRRFAIAEEKAPEAGK